MDFHFNLLDDPWIPCARDGHSPPELLGLRAVLAQAASLTRIVDTRPTTTIALHRLILALLHRAQSGPRTGEAWRAMWNQRAQQQRVDSGAFRDVMRGFVAQNASVSFLSCAKYVSGHGMMSFSYEVVR